MSKKKYYEVWFKEEPFYMSKVSAKTYRMLKERSSKTILGSIQRDLPYDTSATRKIIEDMQKQWLHSTTDSTDAS